MSAFKSIMQGLKEALAVAQGMDVGARIHKVRGLARDKKHASQEASPVAPLQPDREP
jgi:hypothetical protein